MGEKAKAKAEENRKILEELGTDEALIEQIERRDAEQATRLRAAMSEAGR